MECRWVLLLLLLTALAGGKEKKPRHHKPGRAVLDRLSSTTLSAAWGGGSRGELLPTPLDVAPFARVSANATCGEPSAEEYCRDTPAKHEVVCDICEGLGGSSSRQHPPEHAVDGDSTTWWQSPTLAAGDEFRNIEFVAILPDKMELLHVIIKAGPSPRPLAWSLEVSSSTKDDDWRMIRAYGDKDHCRRLWDLRPERRRRKARAAKAGKRTNRADKLTCSTQFAGPRPLENGEMHVALGEGVTCRRVRISFRAAHNAGRQHYYTVRALTLAARCLCHGHAEHCHVTKQGTKCTCLHDRCGSHCQRGCRQDGRGEECGCGGRGACAYDLTGAVLCVNCTDNRAGPLCDRCLEGYYSEHPDGPCQPCTCNVDGSDGTCTWNRKHRAIICNCYPGFTGYLCDLCEDSKVVFPECQLVETTPYCKCDPRGIVDPTRVCDDVCQCKENVMGERCDACAAGHFGLRAQLPEGCIKCYCSHIADSCVLAEESEGTNETVEIPLSEGWLVIDGQLNETLEPSLDEEGKPYLISYEVEGWESFYWSTHHLSGMQLPSYGKRIVVSMFWGIVRGDTGGNPTTEPDFVLLAADGTKLIYSNQSHDVPGHVELSASLVEGEWFRVTGDQVVLATRTELMDVLSDVGTLMIRAHFHGDQDEVRLDSVQLRPPSNPIWRESCNCPVGYAGAHCELCAWAHVALPAQTGQLTCVPCPCNGHAHCDTVDGPCGPCQHNTTGPHCERCLPGYYGNPVQGGCKRCACPLYDAANNFSPNCALASAEGDEFVCTQCPDGYTGDHCESCDSGYWGSPTTAGGSCEPCACAGAACHPDTGLCITCPPHTEGARCDQCQEGYWFGPEGWSGAGSQCVSCACGGGALSAACDARTGQCACRQGYAGRACDTCVRGHGDVTAGCPACHCGVAALDNWCDVTTGACACAPGAKSPLCDDCLEGHYQLDVTGCLGCNCSALGAESNVCDIRTGQCRCKVHVTGRACDTCEEGYWGLSLGGCRRCSCGAGAAACDPDTGLCACAVGVTGTTCDTCLPGYYGFGPNGCLPCPPCSEGKICSPESGQCVCPARTRGPGCKQCATGYWSRVEGCKPCACGPGATSDACDPLTGQCTCRLGWSGLRCDACAPGHFGPRCRPCGCHPPGAKDCVNGTCVCDNMGRCPCKENVVGDKCDTCLPGTFGLSASSPVGCTACYCFGRSARCEQAQLTRATVHTAAPEFITVLQGEGMRDVDQDSLLAVHTHSPNVTISLPWPPVPVYMELDQRFLGDHVTSYGGALRFRVEEEGGRQLPDEVRNKFPLVRIFGKNIVLDYYERTPPMRGSHAVRLHESLWAVRTRSGPLRASRPALMLALSNLQAVMIRVTTRAPTQEDKVYAVVLNVTLDTTMPGLSRSEPALGVEVCDCPRGYAAESCHRPAVGYWLPQQEVTFTDVHGTIVINLEGEAQPCHCNNRATECDPVTGDCLNCTGATGGPRCSECAAGYLGHPDRPSGCRPCPCPSTEQNFAAACAITHGRLHCLCKPGYAGMECESCALGYIRSVDGECEPCGCSPVGALSTQCDARGLCRCKPFATGPKCDQCLTARTALEEERCAPCDNCTQTLLDSIEALSLDLQRRANPIELSRIPKPFPALLEYAHNTTMVKDAFENFKKQLQRTKDLEPVIDNLKIKEQRLLEELNRIKSEATRKEQESGDLASKSMSELEEILEQQKKIGEIVGVLQDFARGERHLTAHRALKEARHILRRIKDIKLIDYMAGANDIVDLANLQNASLQEYQYRLTDSEQRVNMIHSGIDQWEQKADDVTRLAAVVWDIGDRVDALAAAVRPRFAAVRDAGLRCRLVMEDITTLSPQTAIDDTTLAMTSSRHLLLSVPSLLLELQNLTAAAEEKEGILYSITPKYREKYLKKVEKYVKELGKKARDYKSLFAGALAASSTGVSAAHAWSEVTALVRNASAAAERAAANARSAAALARGAQPMTNTAQLAMAHSEELKMRGLALLEKAEELRSQLDQLRRGADMVSVWLRAVGWQEHELTARPTAHVRDTLAAATATAHRVFGMARALYDEASEVRRTVRYQLRRQLAELQKHGDSALGAAQEHVSQIRSNTVRGAELAGALDTAAAARAKEHHAAASVLEPALQALKDKISSARHAAGTISVSLTSLPGSAVGCARAFALQSRSAAVTELAIVVSFDRLVRDGPLLYLTDDTKESENYMSLSVQNQRLLLSWSLGAGEASIQHPEVLRMAIDDGDHTAYKINIQRVWNTVRLTVERSGGSPVTATNSSGGAAVTLSSTRLWAGRPADPNGLSGPLPACLHALYVDNTAIGLWNFVHQPKEAKCTGCTQRWSAVSPGGSVWFSGSGYAALRRSRRLADRRQFSLAFTFTTTDSDALLFMALDTVNNRSVSVALRSCRVVFTVSYGGSKLEIAARGAHCRGRPAHVQATRALGAGPNGDKLERGSLRVNGEETLGSPWPAVHSAAALPDLSSAVYWLGGLPPGVTIPEDSDPPPPLLGCLGRVAVDREGYDLLDTPTRHGVEPSCGARTLRSALLEGSGYIELAAPLLRRKAALGISFRSEKPNGIILFRPPAISRDNEVDDEEDGDERHYLLLVLVDGQLQLVAAAGKAELQLKTNDTRYDDGRLHTVRIVRAHKQLELWADEALVAEGVLAGNAWPARSRGLFLGGVAEWDNSRPPSLNVTAFTGTLADLIVDGALVGLESSVQWEGAQLGRARWQPATAGPAPPTELHAQPHAEPGCAKRASYTVEAGAVKFGDSPSSHATVKLPPKKKDLTVQLQIRTFAADGLLLLTPGPKLKPKHYTALLLKEGKPRLIVRGRRRKEVALNLFVADGTWRTITISVSRSQLVIQSGGVAATARGGMAARAQRLYLGGLPDVPALPTLPNAIRRIGGYVGCMRQVTVGGKAEDLVRRPATHHAVGQCFPDVEPAAYFAGDAYAIWSPSWRPGGGGGSEGGAEVRLQFRTADPAGTLLATAQFLIEIKDGAVVLSRLRASADTVRVEAVGPGGAPLCDNAWHSVVAHVGRTVVSLALDAQPARKSEAVDVLLDDVTDAPLPPAPLYIGGVPEGIFETADGQENFKGCLREVSVGGHTQDWAHMHLLHNVLRDSCPVAS